MAEEPLETSMAVLDEVGLRYLLGELKNAIDYSTFNIDKIFPKTAEAHNSVYRGQDITAGIKDGSIQAAIQNGTFENIWVGDYFSASYKDEGSVICRVAHLNYYDDLTEDGSSIVKKNHAVIIPDTCLEETKISYNISESASSEIFFTIHSNLYSEIVPNIINSISESNSDFSINILSRLVNGSPLKGSLLSTNEVSSSAFFFSNIEPSSTLSELDSNSISKYGYTEDEIINSFSMNGKSCFSMFNLSNKLLSDKSYYINSVYPVSLILLQLQLLQVPACSQILTESGEFQTLINYESVSGDILQSVNSYGVRPVFLIG